jgi:hypothetical protein
MDGCLSYCYFVMMDVSDRYELRIEIFCWCVLSPYCGGVRQIWDQLYIQLVHQHPLRLSPPPLNHLALSTFDYSEHHHEH